jgi:ribosomal protein L40E
MMMEAPFSPSWFLIIAAMVVAFVSLKSARRRRRLERMRFDPRVCGRCGMSQPGHAAYCRHCGERL